MCNKLAFLLHLLKREKNGLIVCMVHCAHPGVNCKKVGVKCVKLMHDENRI